MGEFSYFRIDPTDFSVETSAFTGITLGPLSFVDALEYDSTRNVYWGTIPMLRQLIRVDASTGQASVVGEFQTVDFPIISGIAFDPITDTLYGLNDTISGTEELTELVTIDRTNVTLTRIGDPGLGLSVFDLDSLAFNPLDRMLYSIVDGSMGDGPHKGNLVRIDPATGIATLLGVPSPVIELYQGIAFVVVAEPGALSMLVCSAIAISARRSPRSQFGPMSRERSGNCCE